MSFGRVWLNVNDGSPVMLSASDKIVETRFIASEFFVRLIRCESLRRDSSRLYVFVCVGGGTSCKLVLVGLNSQFLVQYLRFEHKDW